MDTTPDIGVSKSAKVDSENVCGRHLIALKSGPQGRFYAENGPQGHFRMPGGEPPSMKWLATRLATAAVWKAC